MFEQPGADGPQLFKGWRGAGHALGLLSLVSLAVTFLQIGFRAFPFLHTQAILIIMIVGLASAPAASFASRWWLVSVACWLGLAGFLWYIFSQPMTRLF